MKLKTLLFFIVVTFVQTAQAQSDSHITLAATIVNEEGQPIPYAHLNIKGKNMGGITNQDGFFNYKIPIEYRLDTLVISSMGLYSLDIPVQQLVENPNQQWIMKEDVIELEGITIYAPNKLLESALETFDQGSGGTPYYKCAGLYTLTSEENETYTLFEQLAYDAYYRGETDDPGIEIQGHRRSIDYSLFPSLYSQKSQSHQFSVRGEILGISILKEIEELSEKIDAQELKITNITEMDGERVYVISEFKKDAIGYVQKRYDYYVSDNLHELKKVTLSYEGVALRPNEKMTNAGKYINDLYEIRYAYYFKTVDGKAQISRTQRIFKSINVERLTGNVINVYKQMADNWIYQREAVVVKPEKFKPFLKFPDVTPYDADYWAAMDARTGYLLPESIKQDMTKELPLEKQYESTNGLIVLKNSIRERTFEKKEQRAQAEITDVNDFIAQLTNNSYEPDYAPDLTWEDIPALMEIAGSTERLTNFPRNILGRYYVEQCPTGIIAMWLIDSIRKNEGKKPRKAWYISPFPVLESENDHQAIMALREKGNQGNVMIKNTNEKLEQAYEAFSNWWEVAQQMSPNKAKRINPLGETDLKWQGL